MKADRMVAGLQCYPTFLVFCDSLLELISLHLFVSFMLVVNDMPDPGGGQHDGGGRQFVGR